MFVVVGTVGRYSPVRRRPRRRGLGRRPAALRALRLVVPLPRGCRGRGSWRRTPRLVTEGDVAQDRAPADDGPPARARSPPRVRPAPTCAPAITHRADAPGRPPRRDAPASTVAPASTEPGTSASGCTQASPVGGHRQRVGAAPVTTSLEAATSACGLPTSRQYAVSTYPTTSARSATSCGEGLALDRDLPAGRDQVDHPATEDVAAGVDLVGDRILGLLHEGRDPALRVGGHAAEGPGVVTSTRCSETSTAVPLRGALEVARAARPGRARRARRR